MTNTSAINLLAPPRTGASTAPARPNDAVPGAGLDRGEKFEVSLAEASREAQEARGARPRPERKL